MQAQKTKYPTYQVPGFSLNTPEQSVFFEPMSLILGASETHGPLFLGSIEAAQDVNLLLQCGVRAVLTVANGTGLKYSPEYVQFHEEVLAEDVESQDLGKYFQQCFAFLEKTRKVTGCLVHCFAGVSRSTSIILAYLIKYYDLSLNDSLNLVRSQRGQILPNAGFMNQLRQFEANHFQKNGPSYPMKISYNQQAERNQQQKMPEQQVQYINPAQIQVQYVQQQYAPNNVNYNSVMIGQMGQNNYSYDGLMNNTDYINNWANLMNQQN